MSVMRKRTRRPRRRMRGALVMIATCFSPPLSCASATASDRRWRWSRPRSARATGRAGHGQSCETPQDLQILHNALQDRASQLDRKEAALQDRLQALRITDREVTQKLAALEAAEADLRKTLTIAESAAEDDLSRLTQVYERMKPKQAAALFEQMDPSFATGFLARMRPEAAAAIMAGLSPQAAHSFSVVLAGRNADVPTE